MSRKSTWLLAGSLGVLAVVSVLPAACPGQRGTTPTKFTAGCAWDSSRGHRTISGETRVTSKAEALDWLGFYVEVLDQQQALDPRK
jgi:hypothetical protein